MCQIVHNKTGNMSEFWLLVAFQGNDVNWNIHPVPQRCCSHNGSKLARVNQHVINYTHRNWAGKKCNITLKEFRLKKDCCDLWTSSCKILILISKRALFHQCACMHNTYLCMHIHAHVQTYSTFCMAPTRKKRHHPIIKSQLKQCTIHWNQELFDKEGKFGYFTSHRSTLHSKYHTLWPHKIQPSAFQKHFWQTLIPE